ncbi:MAG: radical SAM family heme chaperone HemW [Halioglobus sp.]|nr:radical SAM family heme chaperone HemW [Halioglobus sp.]
MNLPPLSLYIHLPWCERKCPYCDFNSHEAADIPEAAYVQHLLRDLQDDLPHVQGRDIASVFIGGGTPSLFSAVAIATLLEGVAQSLHLTGGAEITMEANPGSAEAAKFSAFRQAGVNRLSLGVQSFDDNCLAALGRVHDRRAALAAVEHAHAAGFDNLNLDLMHGLPGQTPGGARADLVTAIDCTPTHLSWYQLTIETNTAFYKRPPTLPQEDSLAAIQAQGEQVLADAGYQQYEVSAYAKPGQRCRHNLNYWTFGDYLGIGAGAHGKVTQSDGAILRYAKTRLPADYLGSASGEFIARRRRLPRDELPGEYVMNALRLRQGFSCADFTARTGLDAARLAGAVAALCERGLLERDGDVIRASNLGYRYLDDVTAQFFPG